MTNHVEHNVESVIFQNAVPEPDFTIDLGIQTLPGSPLQNENHVQIIHTPVNEISENVQLPVPLQNNTNDTTSIQNGITLPTNTFLGLSPIPTLGTSFVLGLSPVPTLGTSFVLSLSPIPTLGTSFVLGLSPIPTLG